MAGLEVAIRTAMTKLGGSLLETLLSVDTGYSGTTIDCGAGHRAAFVSLTARRPSGPFSDR